ncbi:MAG TPA: hypothetical protein VF533_01040 [Solirubrobacteraceae bacterium]|jgi:hypothetical protein
MTHPPIPAGRIRRTRAAACLATATVLIAGCGGDDDYANKPRPPAPINVTASITDEKVSVSPRRFGAGPIVLIIANQSGQSQEVSLETDEPAGATSKPGIRQKTSPVNPRGTAELKVDVAEGTYKVSVSGGDVRPATMDVGEPRETAQNELLQP